MTVPQFTANRAALLNALTIANRGVAKRTTMLILTHILVEADQETGTVTVTGSDLEKWIRHTFQATVRESGSCTLPGKMFKDCKRDQYQLSKGFISMDDVSTVIIRKGLCLVLWRQGRGKIGERVRISNDDLQWQLNAVGIKAQIPQIQSALTGNAKSSWFERKIMEDRMGLSEYRLTQMTGQRAKEAAAELGTELLPKPLLPELTISDTLETFGGAIIETPAITTASPNTDTDFIERMLNVLTLASDAGRLQAALEETQESLKRCSLLPAAREAITAAQGILTCISMLDKEPLGMMLNKEFKDRGTALTLDAGTVAETLAEHFGKA